MKQIATTAKYTESHDRLTLTVKFPNGEKLRLNSSRYRDSLSTTRPVGSAPLPTGCLQAIMNSKCQTGENNGQRFKRLAAFFEANTTSIAQAAAAL